MAHGWEIKAAFLSGADTHCYWCCIRGKAKRFWGTSKETGGCRAWSQSWKKTSSVPSSGTGKLYPMRHAQRRLYRTGHQRTDCRYTDSKIPPYFFKKTGFQSWIAGRYRGCNPFRQRSRLWALGKSVQLKTAFPGSSLLKRTWRYGLWGSSGKSQRRYH